MIEQWQELKETITEMRDNANSTGYMPTQQEVCKFLANLMDILEKQMSGSENPNKWIPCSERLPEKSDRYLAYIVNRHDDKLQYIMTCDYSVDGYWNWFPDAESASDNVVAWMPLPEPYKPQERSDKE